MYMSREWWCKPVNYMPACKDPSSADAVLVMDDGTELLAHTDILRRMCGLFKDILEDTPMDGGLLRVPVAGHDAVVVANVLLVAYHVACLADVLAEDNNQTPINALVNETLLPVWREDEDRYLRPDIEDPVRCATAVLSRMIVGRCLLWSTLRGFVCAADFLRLDVEVVERLLFAFDMVDHDVMDAADCIFRAIDGVPGLERVRAHCVHLMLGAALNEHRHTRVTLADVRREMGARESTDLTERFDRLGWLMREHDRDGAPRLPWKVALALCQGTDVTFGFKPPEEKSVATRVPCMKAVRFGAVLGDLMMSVDDRQFHVVFEVPYDWDVAEEDQDMMTTPVRCCLVLKRGIDVEATVAIKGIFYDRHAETYEVKLLHSCRRRFQISDSVTLRLPLTPHDIIIEHCDPFGTVHLFVEFTE